MKAFFEAGWHSITMATLAGDMETDRTIPPKTFVITFDDGWSDGYDYAFPILRQYGFVGTFFMIGGRIDQVGALSTPELRALEAAGNEIGNHTLDHVSLQNVQLSYVTQEVDDASVAIARATGHRPVSFAYPMGGISTPTMITVSQVPDMKIAVTTGYGQTETWAERYDTPRVRIHPTTDPAKLIASLSF
jgi:peptidoglycan/xylan/chitin deacetylase (PgdA/CDA1 family)